MFKITKKNVEALRKGSDLKKRVISDRNGYRCMFDDLVLKTDLYQTYKNIN